MDYVQVQSYGNKQGSKTNFIMSGDEAKQGLVKTLDFLQSVRTFPGDGQQTIDEEVNNAIVRA